MSPTIQRPPIAIVGLGALFPESVSVDGFWKNILDGRDLISEVPPTHWLIDDYYDPDPSAPDKTYGKRGGFLGKVDFDPLAWGIPPSILPATDTTQLLSLIVAKQCLEDAARGQFATMDRSRISVILGVTSAQELLGTMVSRLQRPIWQKALREQGFGEERVQKICDDIASNYVPWQESSFPGLLGNVVAGRIANRLDLGGTNCVTDAACASSFSAIHMGVNELYLGDSDVVLAGGADTMNDIFMHMCFSKTPALSPSGDCRPFSDRADGTLLGEGICMFALKRLEDAERDGDKVYALLRGIGASSDGRAKSVYAPRPEGQTKALERAYAHAGYGAKTVELVEAHGTGTKAGDAAEFEGLRSFFQAADDDRQWCGLGSIKSQIGHTKAAAGAAGLFKAVMSLHQAVLPPTIKVDRPNPQLDIEQTPFYVNTRLRPWVRGIGHPRRAGVSSFGFGGSNFHLALEEYTAEKARIRTPSHELVLLSADSASELRSEVERLQADLKQELPIQWLAQRSLSGFESSKGHRLAIVAKDGDELGSKLGMASGMIGVKAASSPNGIHYGNGQLDGKTAFLFPGQGSQYVEMASAAACTWPSSLGIWDRAAAFSFDGKGLHDVVFPIPVFDKAAADAQQELLTQTEWAQPAIGCASLSHYALLSQLGLSPDFVCGHSYGEVTALHAAGVLSETDFLRVSRKRGELMAEAAKRPGSMSAVKSSSAKLEPLLAKWGLDVVIANQNSPVQCVISGPTEAIEEAEKRLQAEGLTAQRLKVATAFHSKVVEPAVAPFQEFLGGIELGSPKIGVFANSTAASYPEDAEGIRSLLAGQIASPVLFVDMIQKMYDEGARLFVEVGPKTVLSKLAKRILRKQPATFVSTDKPGTEGIYGTLDGLGQLAACGADLRWDRLWADHAPVADPADREVMKMAVGLNGSNHGKIYPPAEGPSVLPGPNPPEVELRSPPSKAIQENTKPKGDTKMSSDTTPKQPASVPQRVQAAPMPATQSSPGWLTAFQAAQQSTAQAHVAYQQAMSQAHMAYLQAAQASFSGLAALAGGDSSQGFAAPTFQAAPQVGFSTPLPAPPVFAPAPPLPATAPSPAFMPAPQPAAAPPQPAAAPQQPAPRAPVAAPVPVAPTASASTVDVTSLLLEVVAEKTGYPAEMLDMGMNLEGDLGVDSIKRVEILSSMQEQAPGLPEVDAGAMASLQTLGQIVEHMQAAMGTGGGASGSSVESGVPSNGSAGPVDITKLLLEVVSEKTGYPAEMLDMGMNLEGDLGVDSIKRVEILSSMQEKAPHLPEVDAGAMASLQTLGQIVEHMRSALGSTAGPSAGGEQAVPSNGGGPVDITKLLLEVVAEKTGYPAEMLDMGMNLEGDLGVDSIKRVEILSSMQEKAPHLPEVDAGAMASLQTLGQIVEHMQEEAGNFSQAEAPSTGASACIPRSVLKAADAPASGFLAADLSQARISILSDSMGIAPLLQRDLAAIGLDVSLDSTSAEVDGIIDLRPLRNFSDAAEASRASLALFESAKAISSNPRLLVAVQSMDGDFGLSQLGGQSCYAAGVAGVVRTAGQEWPDALCKVVDLAPPLLGDPAAAAGLIAKELLHGGSEIEIGYTESAKRRGLSLEEQSFPEGPLPLGREDVVVVSGGARGVTAATVVALARETASSFVLVGRTALAEDPCPKAGSIAEINRALLSIEGPMKPTALRRLSKGILAGREVRGTLASIEKVGARARYVSLDVTDAAALAAALQTVRKDWGPVTAIVHGAGVLADKKIADKSPSDFQWVFDVKVLGLRSMLVATGSDPLKAIVLFSSVAARSGNQGQSDYAAANEVLNKVAHREAALRPGCIVKSLGWGPWEGGMVTPALKAHFESMGVPLIPIEGGARALVDELRGQDATEIVLGGAEGLATARDGARFHLFLHPKTHPHLFDHQVKGEVVVPMAMVADWFLRACRAWLPNESVSSLSGLRVLRPLRLGTFREKGAWLRISVDRKDGQLKLLLSDSQGARFYAADGLMGSPQELDAPALDGEGWEGEIYAGPLFHGPAFQMIRSIGSVSENGMQADLVGCEALQWPAERWNLDPAAVDGCLQLALLWTQQQLKRHSLPMSIAGIDLGRASGRITCCRLIGQKASGSKARSDAYLLDDKGGVVAALRGVETIALPAEV
jgi:acyl transferase domain-containing protein/NAD(P)-dependent dehydrogenase (short-subunit alcohol dehydrogenase family)/acyl carrier protein